MAKVIYEKRSFKDRATGVTTEYDYYAVVGTDEQSREYEVVFKNLVQSEKMVLKVIALAENKNDGEITSRKANEDEKPSIEKKTILDDDDENRNWFGK